MEEETLEFDKTLKTVEVLFRCAGIYIRSGARTASNRLKARCLYTIHFLIANHELFASIFWCIDGVRNGIDFLGITYSIPCITISILAQFKGIFMIKNEEHANRLIDKLRGLEIKEKESKQSSEKDKLMKKETKFLNLVLKTLNIFYAGMVLGFSISPLVLIAVKYFQTAKVELTLPFLVTYVFDPFQMKVWPFAYFNQCWSEYVVCLDICSADYFFFTCCTYIRIHFLLLQHDLENIIPIEVNSNKKFVEDDEFKNNLKKLIKRHQDLIESADILEIIYSKSTLLNFLSSSVIICLTGFNVTTVDDVANVVTFINFLFMSLLQVFFLCFFADLLMTSSTDISAAVYNSLWYKAETKIGNKLLVILSRSQKPCKVTAAGFADVSLTSFMRVLSTAWSYFTLLETMYGN